MRIFIFHVLVLSLLISTDSFDSGRICSLRRTLFPYPVIESNSLLTGSSDMGPLLLYTLMTETDSASETLCLEKLNISRNILTEANTV